MTAHIGETLVIRHAAGLFRQRTITLLAIWPDGRWLVCCEHGIRESIDPSRWVRVS